MPPPQSRSVSTPSFLVSLHWQLPATQPPPQVEAHCPPVQNCPLPHAFSHAPQWSGSKRVSVQVPSHDASVPLHVAVLVLLAMELEQPSAATVAAKPAARTSPTPM